MLLTRLNPLKDLSDEERKTFIEDFRNKEEAFGDQATPRVDERAGHRQGVHVPGGGAHQYEFADNVKRAVREAALSTAGCSKRSATWRKAE